MRLNPDRIHPPIVLVMCLALAQTSWASPLATYDFDLGFGGLDLGGEDASFVAPGVTAQSVVSAVTVGYGTTGLFIRSSNTAGTDFTEAVAADDYFEITIAPAGSDPLTVTQLTFNLRNQYDIGQDIASPKRGSLTTTVIVQSDETGFGVSNPILGTFTLTNTNFADNTTAQSANLSLGNVTTDRTFRFYIFDDGDESNSITRIQDLNLNGTVVPEPSSALVLLLCTIGLMRRET